MLTYVMIGILSNEPWLFRALCPLHDFYIDDGKRQFSLNFRISTTKKRIELMIPPIIDAK